MIPTTDQIVQLIKGGHLSEETGGMMTPALQDATIQVESGGNPDAVSPKGAVGLMQVTPIAARDVLRGKGIDDSQLSDEIISQYLKNPEINKAVGTEYMKLMQTRFGDPKLAAAAYNGGPSRLDSVGRDISKMPQETQEYVPKIEAAGGFGAPNMAAKQAEPVTEEQVPDDPFQMQQFAAQQGALAQEKVLTEIQGEQVKQAQMLEQARVEQETRMVAQQQRVDEAITAREDAWSQLEGAKVDPNNYWNSTSTTNKIIAGIGIALGGVASGMKGGPNVALSVIENAIDRDMESQKTDINKKLQVASSKDKLYNDLLGRIQNEEAAKAATLSIRTKAAQSMIESYVTQSKMADAKAKGVALIGELEAKKQKHDMEMEKALRKSPEYIDKNIEEAKTPEGKIDSSKLTPEARKLYVQGEGFAATVPEARELRDSQGALRGLMSSLDSMLERRKDEGPVFSAVEGYHVLEQYKSDYSSLTAAIKALHDLGALDEGVERLVKAGFPTPEQMTSVVRSDLPLIGSRFENPYESKITQMKERLQSEYNAYLKAKISKPEKGSVASKQDITITYDNGSPRG